MSEENGFSDFSMEVEREYISEQLFSLEGQTIEEFMQNFDRFQINNNVPENDRFVSVPKCYPTPIHSDTELRAIFLGDIHPDALEMWYKITPKIYPIENVRLAMRELGKFHGLSLTMKNQEPQKFNGIKEIGEIYPTFCQSKNIQEFYGTAYDRAIESLRNDEYKNIMRHIKDNFLLYIEDCFDAVSADRFGVLCHGDVWNNNMLFTFNEGGVPEDIRFLDWQVIRYVSPAIDILYKILISTDKAIRDNEYENLIKLYHESLCKMVGWIQNNPDELFTLDNLNDELKRYGNFALIMAPLLIQTSQAKSSEYSTLDEFFDNLSEGGDKDITTGLSGKGQSENDRKLNEVFEDILRLGYYRKINER